MISVRRGLIVAACVISALHAVAAEALTIRWLADEVSPAVEVLGVPAETLRAHATLAAGDPQWAQLLSVFAEQGSTTAPAGSTMPAMLGVWSIRADRVRFEPQFPFSRGVRYRAEVRVPGARSASVDAAGSGKSASLAPSASSRFELAADLRPPSTEVVQVYPSAGTLPENQLKFYVEFSAPMSRGGVYDHIRILDAAGKAVDLAFLELDEELWDPTMTRLTLLIDPGRIKRGVKPLEDVGPVFAAGRSYTLVVDAACRDASNRPLRLAFAKKFAVAEPDRTSPDPVRWKVHAPAAGSRAPLVVEFDEPMDRALALRLIGVAGEKDGPLEGAATLEREERRWTFVPAQTWRVGTHLLVVPTTIEDLAGNNIGKTFDVDLFEGVHRRITTLNATVRFEVK